MTRVRARGPGDVAGKSKDHLRRRVIEQARHSVGERAAQARPAHDEQLAAIQRSRLLDAAVETIAEIGYGQATVAQITARARVSRRTFYELFDNREECLVALLDEIVATVERELAAAGVEGLPWCERVRGGLWTILCFLDREPALAQVCIVQALGGGLHVLERREGTLAQLAAVLDEGRREGPHAGRCTQLTAEGLVGAAFGIVHARLLRRDRRPLRELLGELMGLITLSYLGPTAARRAQNLPLPAFTRPAHAACEPVTRRRGRDPLQDVPMRLTYRTARVLGCIAEQPGISNRAVAERAGIVDQGQMSKLLARLARLGLAVNDGTGHAKGEANAWMLTPLGQRVAKRLQVGDEAHKEEAA
jgi:AcrR family transcriptional regulator/DNA-binding MarR family transcriptional regulator